MSEVLLEEQFMIRHYESFTARDMRNLVAELDDFLREGLTAKVEVHRGPTTDIVRVKVIEEDE